MNAAAPGFAARLSDLSHRYGARPALAGVSLSIPTGAMIGLIGPDGVGKSTLLSLLAGVRRVQTGRAEVLGGDIADSLHRRAVCERIAYMPQGLGQNLYPTLSVRENLDFFARLFGQDAAERDERIAVLLTATGLSPFPDRPAGKLSGGMKQKLGLCCALVHDPDLLILDEPTTGVDPLSRRQFWDLIAGIRRDRPGLTVIVATAYMGEAEGFERLVAMDGGRVLAEGTPAEIRAAGGGSNLEEAFVGLLPEERKAGYRAVVLPPRVETDGPPAIEAQGLTMRFGDFTAVDHVSFRIERGEIFGFLGSNGCGKTTTMKMLTGLLPASEGVAKLFDRPVESGDLATRRRVGYMSQSFSLYSELTVRQNLDLHAGLFGLSGDHRRRRIDDLLQRFRLAEVAGDLPTSLSLGVRQRLQLAVAVLHAPEVLILDEPTSGVDPIARDGFWNLLIGLSRDEGVTIFISTHFMNEAERCDRISLMHAGRVLAVGSPESLRESRGAPTLEAAFIGYLEEAAAEGAVEQAPPPPAKLALGPENGGGARDRAVARVWAFARREAMELLRDRIRLAFALGGPLVLMLAMGLGISFDVENLTYAVLDRDRSQASQIYLQNFSSSRYFEEAPEIRDFTDLDRRLQSGALGFAIVIPPGFGRDLLAGRTPEVGVWLDGANTNRAETARGYVEGVHQAYLADLARRETGEAPILYPVTVETRFRYNQAFRSVYAIPPGILMMLSLLVPAMLTALGVVREKELGSIVNFYATPASAFEFLFGKQLPYIGIALLSVVSMVLLMRGLFGVPLAGSLGALAVGALLYVTAATAFGLVISTVVGSQIAAIFGTAIIVTVPTINFSGMLYPVAGLEGGAKVLGQLFPALYFQNISSGVFSKGLGFAELFRDQLILAGFCLLFWAIAAAALPKQQR